MTNYAAQEGNSECLQYLLYLNCPAVDAMRYACQEGRIDSLQILHEHGVPWDKNTTKSAAEYKQLECLQYLHENGCPWGEQVSTEVAQSGSLEMLRYCLDNGCPYDDNIMIYSAASRSENALGCVRYLIEEQGIYMNRDGRMFAAALGNANVELVKYLLDSGCPYQDHYNSAHYHLKSNLQQPIFLRMNTTYYAKDAAESFAADLLECVILAADRKYNFTTDFLRLLCTEFPLCKEFLESEGYVQPGIFNLMSVDNLSYKSLFRHDSSIFSDYKLGGGGDFDEDFLYVLERTP